LFWYLQEEKHESIGRIYLNLMMINFNVV